jgi:hypothetical protein
MNDNLTNENLETKLREALRPQQPSTGFAERVIRQAESGQRPVTIRPRYRLLWPAAFAAAAALVFSVSVEYRSLEEQRAGQQAIEALQIASDALNTARNVLNQ